MNDKNIVVIGGGVGTNIVLSGLKRYTSQLTALISTFNAASRSNIHAAGSAGASQTTGGTGEVRGSLIALSANKATTQIMEQLFAHHLPYPIGISNDFGDLFLSALLEISGGVDLAMQAAAHVLKVHGSVFPLTLDECALMAELGDGTLAAVTTSQELTAAASKKGLRSVRLSRPVAPLDASIEAIEQADIVVIGPADFYFSVLAPLQIEGVSEALAMSKAVKIFVCPLMTQPHLTVGWSASDFMRTVFSYIGGSQGLHCTIANSAILPHEKIAEKAERGSHAVHLDLEECFSLGMNVIVRPIVEDNSLLHDADKLARTIIFLSGGRSSRSTNRSNFLVRDRAGQGVAAPAIVTPTAGKAEL